MVHDIAGPEFDFTNMEESPNQEAQKFYDMLAAANEELSPGCGTHSQLSAAARCLSIKSNHHLSEKCYDEFVGFVKEVLPEDNKMVDSFYNTKKLVQGLGLPVEKIDCCQNGCMIF